MTKSYTHNERGVPFVSTNWKPTNPLSKQQAVAATRPVHIAATPTNYQCLVGRISKEKNNWVCWVPDGNNGRVEELAERLGEVLPLEGLVFRMRLHRYSLVSKYTLYRSGGY